MYFTNNRRPAATRPRSRAPRQFKGKTRPNVPISSKFKTEMCHYLSEQGRCPFGTICTYAHSQNELRHIVRHPKHKTQPCRDFSNNGFCPFGERCSFVHEQPNLDEICNSRNSSVRLSISPVPSSNYGDDFQMFDRSNEALTHNTLLLDTNTNFLRPPTVSSGYSGSPGSSFCGSPSNMSRSSSTSDLSDFTGTRVLQMDFENALRLPVFRNMTSRKLFWDQ